jgi:hypothetical protein
MRISQERICNKVAFVLKTGQVIHPVMMTRQDTGNVAFRVSDGGNKVCDSKEVDEQTMIQMVLVEGLAVRCASLDGKIHGIYRPAGRAVREVRVWRAAL